jgi:hypothetical protein
VPCRLTGSWVPCRVPCWVAAQWGDRLGCGCGQCPRVSCGAVLATPAGPQPAATRPARGSSALRSSPQGVGAHCAAAAACCCASPNLANECIAELLCETSAEPLRGQRHLAQHGRAGTWRRAAADRLGRRRRCQSRRWRRAAGSGAAAAGGAAAAA